MLDILHAVPSTQPIIRLNHSFCADLPLWRTFLTQWNGLSFLPPPSLLPETSLTTHTSRLWAVERGTATGSNLLIPIILACAVWAVHGRDTMSLADVIIK